MSQVVTPTEPGWRPDPSGRYEWRYWDGGWTNRVANSAAAPAPEAPAPPTPPAPAAAAATFESSAHATAEAAADTAVQPDVESVSAPRPSRDSVARAP